MTLDRVNPAIDPQHVAPKDLTMTRKSTSSIHQARRGMRPVAPSVSRLTPIGLTEVTLAGTGFWGSRVKVNADATIQHCASWLERAGWLGNFDAAAAGALPGLRQGREFADSEVYKLFEAMAWQHGATGDDRYEELAAEFTRRVSAAQDADGYLNTNFGRPGQQPRYSDLEWGHELYNFGHLLQAAVARARTSGEDDFVRLARRVADHICDTFGDDGIRSVCGHPEVELGLIEFGRLTGERRYLEQARIFLERRGHGVLADIEWGRSYYQDDVPVRDAKVLRGHAVRALYLAAAAVDIAVEFGDTDLLEAVEAQYARTIATRTYLTGGMGSHHQDEAFGEDFVLPSDRAYCESCAGIASVMLAWRLLLATGNPQYGDIVERTLYNIVAAAPAEDGRSFFYANTLHQRIPGDDVVLGTQSKRAASSTRASWFDVSCCPNNIARTFASLTGYLATVDEGGLQLHQYAAATIDTELGDGRRFGVSVHTDYPNSGLVTLQVHTAPQTPVAVTLRVPAWAIAATLTVGGVTSSAPVGSVVVERVFEVGDELVLTLPMTPRFTWPDERIDAVRGSVAVEWGPRVLSLESVDLPAGSHVDDFVVDSTVPPRIDGVGVVVSGTVVEPHRPGWPFRSNPQPARGRQLAASVPLVPYHSWGNRGPGTMRVWLRTV